MVDKKNLTIKDHQIDRELSRIGNRISVVTPATPLNISEEQKPFLTGQKTNPHFKYPSTPTYLPALQKKLVKLQIPTGELGQLFSNKKAELINMIKARRALGSTAFTNYAEKIYGLPDQATLKVARSILNVEKAGSKIDPRFLSTSSVIEVFRAALDRYDLKDWSVKKNSKLITGARVYRQKKIVFVKAKASIALSRVKALVVHEIETHVITSVNAARQPLKTLFNGFAGYIRTEEGLAGYNISTQLPDFSWNKQVWARNALAAAWANQKSFRYVFEKIKKYSRNEAAAFGATLRVKRGLTDTSQPGGLMKDYIYLAGYLDVQNFIKKGGNLSDLYLGKFNLQDLDTFKSFSWLKPPKLLPDFLTDASAIKKV